MSLALNKLKRRPSADVSKPKKKIDRFDGLTEEEVQKYTLEDILEPDLDLVFVGINPSLMAAHRGRYYAGPGNHFYKLLHESGLVPRFVSFEEDHKLLNYKIGLTNIVGRATRSSADLKKPEIKEGSAIVREKLRIFKPKVAIFNGKCIYEVFADITGKSEFYFGLQRERIGDTAIWVVPSSSARCAHFPRMEDKLHFYLAIKKYLSFLKGEIADVDLAEFRFEGKCKQSIPSTSRMWRRKNTSAFLYGGRVANKDTVCLDTSDENIATVNCREFIITEILGENSNEKKDSSQENVRQESKSDDSVTAPEIPTTKSPKKIEINRKRRWKKSPTIAVPSQTVKPRESDNSMDFMNLIKQRLSEKKDRVDTEEKSIEMSSTQSIIAAPTSLVKEKKLKYANLRLKTAE